MPPFCLVGKAFYFSAVYKCLSKTTQFPTSKAKQALRKWENEFEFLYTEDRNHVLNKLSKL